MNFKVGDKVKHALANVIGTIAKIHISEHEDRGYSVAWQDGSYSGWTNPKLIELIKDPNDILKEIL